MFDWFKKRDYSNVVPFPEQPKVVPYIEPEKPAMTFYRMGLTDNNRLSFTMGYSEVTFNRDGVNNLIKQLELFRDQLQELQDDSEEQ